MTRFVDAIDRLFEELVHDAWRAPRPAYPPRQSPDSILEIRLPIAGARCGDVSLATDGQRLTITARHAAAETTKGADSVSEEQAQLQQSITLPVGTEAGAVEVCFDVDMLRFRIHLRTRSGS